MRLIAKVIVSMMLLAPLLAFDGWVLTYLWQWFAMPIFGVQALGVAQAIGLRTAVVCFSGRHWADDTGHGTWAEIVGAFINAALASASVLLTGWVVHLFL